MLHAARRDRRPLLGLCLPAGWPPALEDDAAAYAQAAAAADIIELAVPDAHAPLDGPVLAAAYRDALRAGYRHAQLPALIRRTAAVGTPVIVMAYWHTIAAAGPETMAVMLADAGAAGIVIPDLPRENSRMWGRIATARGLHTILLAGHPARGSGAVYLPAAPGRIGTAARPAPDLVRRVRSARTTTGLPVIAGIGISSPARAAQAARAGADVVLVGTTLAEAIQAHPESPARAVNRLASRFRAGLTDARRPHSCREARDPGCPEPAFSFLLTLHRWIVRKKRRGG